MHKLSHFLAGVLAVIIVALIAGAVYVVGERIAPGRTTIIIAHRLSTVCFADSIVVLGQGGRILERGTHQELLDRDGHYAALWRVQTGL